MINDKKAPYAVILLGIFAVVFVLSIFVLSMASQGDTSLEMKETSSQKVHYQPDPNSPYPGAHSNVTR